MRGGGKKTNMKKKKAMGGRMSTMKDEKLPAMKKGGKKKNAMKMGGKKKSMMRGGGMKKTMMRGGGMMKTKKK